MPIAIMGSFIIALLLVVSCGCSSRDLLAPRCTFQLPMPYGRNIAIPKGPAYAMLLVS